MNLPRKILHVLSKLPKTMAIINLTDDSFSHDGLYLKNRFNANSSYTSSNSRYLKHLKIALQAVEDGARIIDIGGESTKPDAKFISVEEEWRRIEPLIKNIVPMASNFKVSVDTRKAEIARRSINEGVHIINDISFGKDKDMFKVISGKDIQYILTHNVNSKVVNLPSSNKPLNIKALYPKNKPAGMKQFSISFINSIVNKVLIAKSEGVKNQQIILDLGFGFGKTIQQNFYLFKLIPRIRKQFSFPLMIGASRKSSIGSIINQEPQQRLSGSLAIAIMARENNIQYIRVHDVRKTIEALAVNYYLNFPEEIIDESIDENIEIQ